MKHYAVQLLALCVLILPSPAVAQNVTKTQLLPVLPVYPTTLYVNLRTGWKSGLPLGMTWHSALTSGSGNCRCDRQGVLKLTFSSTRVLAFIKMTFEGSVGYTFNVGDSVSNNGYGGDFGHQRNDAEVHSKNRNIYFHGRDSPAGGSYGLLQRGFNFVAVYPLNTITLIVGDGMAIAHNGLHFLPVVSHKLFRLRGQFDFPPGGINWDLYLGLNRVVGTSSRNGRGLCTVSVRFYSL